MTEHATVSVDTLKAIAAAFNAHDLDAIMEFFAKDCTLEMPRGPEPWGQRYTGKPAVREGSPHVSRDCPTSTTATIVTGSAGTSASRNGC